MLRIGPSESVQWQEHGKHYVGRVMTRPSGMVVDIEIGDKVLTLVKLDYDGGLAFVDARKLLPYPSSPIPEPGLPMMEGPVS